MSDNTYTSYELTVNRKPSGAEVARIRDVINKLAPDLMAEFDYYMENFEVDGYSPYMQDSSSMLAWVLIGFHAGRKQLAEHLGLLSSDAKST